jgi:4-oxalocrotonate tautomerase
MPFLQIQLLTGRSPERKRALIERVTAAVVEALEVRPDQVRIILTEVPPEHWGVAGETMADRATAGTR